MSKELANHDTIRIRIASLLPHTNSDCNSTSKADLCRRFTEFFTSSTINQQNY